jgi:hypothetical protein
LMFNWFISVMSCPIIIFRFMGGFCTLGIGIDIDIDNEISVDIEVDVGVWFCKMPKEWPFKLYSFNFAIVWPSSSVLAPSYWICWHFFFLETHHIMFYNQGNSSCSRLVR